MDSPRPPQTFEEFCAEFLLEGDMPPGSPRMVARLAWDAASAAKQVEIDELKAENERLKRKLQGHNAKLDGQIEATGIAEARYDALAADADALAEAALYVDSHTDADRVFDLRTANARYLEARKSE